MEPTSIDPCTALIIVDLQKSFAAMPSAHPMSDIIERAATLADAFRRHQLPVVLVNTDGAAPGRRGQTPPAPPQDDGEELVPALDARPGDHRVTKRTPGAFTGTALEDHLRVKGVTQVVIAGVATATGVEMTARQAYELGFNVTPAIDAMTDMDADAHANSVQRIFPRISVAGTTGDIVALLDARP